MAYAVNFSGLLPGNTICFRARAGVLPGSMLTRSSDIVQKFTKLEQLGICFKRQLLTKPSNYRRFNSLTPLAADSDDIILNHLSAATVIKNFYTCINEKKMKELDEYISDDCWFEDCSFIHPIQGKKEVMDFYRQLITGMGQNVKFRIEHVCQDDESTAGVNWHLEWKNTQIPFTRGCSFYECVPEGDRLVIKKARVVIESPLKPGGMALTLLKNVTAIFDDFPKFAEWFLKSTHVIVQFLMKIYAKLLAPVVNPLLAGYIRIWNFMVRMFALALATLLYILKKYFQ